MRAAPVRVRVRVIHVYLYCTTVRESRRMVATRGLEGDRTIEKRRPDTGEYTQAYTRYVCVFCVCGFIIVSRCRLTAVIEGYDGYTISL